MKVRTTVLSGGKTATGIEVPAEVVEQLGGGKRAKVRVTIGDHTSRSSIAVMDGRFMIGVSAEVRGSDRCRRGRPGRRGRRDRHRAARGGGPG